MVPPLLGRTTKLEKEQQRNAFWEVITLSWRQSIEFNTKNNCAANQEMMSKVRSSYGIIAGKISNPDIERVLTSTDFTLMEPDTCSRVLESAIQSFINTIDPLPLPAKVPSFDKGELAYNKYCASCHGDNGNGKAELSKYFLPEQVLLRRSAATSLAPIYVYSIALTGLNGMPGFADKLGQDELWDLAYFVASFVDVADSSAECSPLNIEMQQLTLFDGSMLKEKFGANECQVRALRTDVSNLNHTRRAFDYSSVAEDPKFKKYGLILLGVFVFLAVFFTFISSITRSRVK